VHAQKKHVEVRQADGNIIQLTHWRPATATHHQNLVETKAFKA